MTFTSAIATCFANYATFRGRARRSEYWFFVLFMILSSLVAAVLDSAIASTGSPVGGLSIFSTILGIVFMLPSLAAGVRRLHDAGHSGWWTLIGVIPVIGTVVLIVFLCQKGDAGPNRFGSDPTPPMQPGPAGAVA